MAEIHPDVLSLMACPQPDCHGALRQEENRLVCEKCARRYRVDQGWPVMIPEEAEPGPDDHAPTGV